METQPQMPTAVSVKKASQLLGVSARTTWGLIESRELTSFRIGKRVLVRLVDIEAFMAKRVKDGAA